MTGKISARPVSERAYRLPKIYRKDAWLKDFWNGIMDDFRYLFACPMTAEEKNGEIVLYVLGLWKHVFRRDGSLRAYTRSFSRDWRERDRERQLGLFRKDDLFAGEKWIWAGDDWATRMPFFGVSGKKQSEKCAASLLYDVIYRMERCHVFVLSEYYDDDECEFHLHGRSFLAYGDVERNMREAAVETVLTGSRLRKYLARSVREFFPSFFRAFSDFFDADFLERLGSAGWIGDYEKYRRYRRHRQGVLRVLSERPNLLLLLEIVNDRQWDRADLFAADNWTKNRSDDWRPKTRPEWCDYYGAEFEWHPVSRSSWKILTSMNADDIDQVLWAGFGSRYDFDKLCRLFHIGRRFPQELLHYALLFVHLIRARHFFVYEHNRKAERELSDMYHDEERIAALRNAVFRAGRLWLAYLADNPSARFLPCKESLHQCKERELSDIMDYIVAQPEKVMNRTMTWTALVRRSRRWHEDMLFNMHRDDFITELSERDKDIWWDPVSERSFDFDGCHIEELCTANDLLTESFVQRNCAVTYVRDCFRHNYHIFRIEGRERATAGVVQGRHGWFCHQLRGFQNSVVTKDTQACVNNLLDILNSSEKIS